jgi:PAS domain S-box-containing protein
MDEPDVSPSPTLPAGAFHLFIDSVEDYAVFMLDPQGRVATWNKGAARIKGYTENEIIGQPYARFFPEADRLAGKPGNALRIAAETGRFKGEGWRLRKDGSRFWADVTITAIRDADGRLLGFGKVTRDMTDRRLAEENRIKLMQTEEAVRLRDEFLSLAAHELRTPLTGLGLQIDGLLRLMERADAVALSPERLVGKLSAAQQQVLRLANLIDELLDIGQIQGGSLPIRPETTDLAALLRQVVDGRADAFPQVESSVTVHGDQAVSGCWDRIRLEQLVISLLSNAMKYGRGQPIEVAVRQEGDHAVLTVRDHGPGIPLADQARIFDRFVRLSSVRHYGGFGIGLWLSREIVTAMGGTIQVASNPGQGSTFTIHLPLRPPSRSADADKVATDDGRTPDSL